MKEKNIAYLVFWDDITSNGIIKNQVIPTLEYMAASNYKMSLISVVQPVFEYNPPSLAKIKERLDKSNIELFILKSDNDPYNPVNVISPILKIINEQHINLIHCRSYFASLIAAKLKELISIPYIFDLRGRFPEEQKYVRDEPLGFLKDVNLDKKYQKDKMVEDYLLRTANASVVLNESFAKALVSNINCKINNLVQIPSFVDRDLFHYNSTVRGLLRKKLGLSNATVFVFSGSMSPWYDFEGLIKLFKKLTDKSPNVYFVILTYRDNAFEKGKYESYIEKLFSDNGIDKKYYGLFSAEYEEIPVWLSASDYGLIYFKEFYRDNLKFSQPIKLAEYLACGLPIIINQEIDELVALQRSNEKCGWIINNQTLDLFLNKFEQNYNEQEYEIFRNTISSLAERYSREKSCSLYYKLYNEILEKQEDTITQESNPLITKALELIEKKDYSEAKTVLERITNNDLKNTEALFLLSNVAMLSNDKDLFLKIYSRLLQFEDQSDRKFQALEAYLMTIISKKITFKESTLAHKLLDGLKGVEIGAAAHNPFGLNTRNIGLRIGYNYSALKNFGQVIKVDIEADMNAIPLPNESEDFVINSHVIEHSPNLIKTLLEWYRVIKPGGYLYIITPKRDAAVTDVDRPLSSWNKLCVDYLNNYESFRDFHYNVFTLDIMKEFFANIFDYRMKLIAEQESDDKVGNGFTVVYQKTASLNESFPWNISYNNQTFDIFSAVNSLPQKFNTQIQHKSCLNKKLKIAVFPHDLKHDGCSHYRIMAPLSLFPNDIEILWTENYLKEGFDKAKENALQADILIVQRFFPCYETWDFINYLFSLKKPLFYEIDDLLTYVPATNPSHNWSNIRRPLINEVIKHSTAMSVTTEELKEHFVEFNQNVSVLPNLLDNNLWKKTSFPNTDELVICYAGTLTHSADLKIIEEALDIIASRYGNKLSFLFMGCKTEHIAKLPNFRFIPPQKNYYTYAENLQNTSIDIMLIPLEVNEFNRCKSNIKWLEYSACGIPGIYSDIEPYSDCVEDGKTGILVKNTTRDWVNAIANLIDNRTLRLSIAMEARIEVLTNYALTKRAKSWLDYYQNNINKYYHNNEINRLENKDLSQLQTIVSFSISDKIPSSQYLRQIAPLQLLDMNKEIRLIDGNSLFARKGNESYLDLNQLPKDAIIFLQRDFSYWKDLLNLPFRFIYDIDDNLLDLPVNHPDMAKYQKLSDLLKANLSRFDCVTVSTYELKKKMSFYNKNIHILPNYLPLMPNLYTKNSTKIRILISGTPSHKHDVQFLIPVISNLFNKYKNQIEIIFWGFCPDELIGKDNIVFINEFTKDYRDYLQKLAEINAQIGLIPLSRDDFNKYKSDIKWKEYSSCQMAVIASDTTPYQSICHGVDGLILENNPELWEKYLERLITDQEYRNNLAENAYNRVKNSGLLSQNINHWEKLISSMNPSRPIKTEQISSQPLISIIIPVFNKIELTQQCLENLFRNTDYSNYEVIIIDNASSDNTAQYLKEITAKNNKIKIITNPVNYGFAKANNQGAELAQGEYIVLLNNDTIPLKGWLTALYTSIQEDSNTGIVGAKMLYPDDSIQHCGVVLRRDRNFFKHPYKFVERTHPLVNFKRKWDAVTAACFITRRDLFRQLGGLDEGYLNGCEDIDYCCAVTAKGLNIYYEPKAELYHFESQTPRLTNKDEDNFKHFVSKWGRYAIKTEHEIFCEDGFWELKGDKYLHHYNEDVLEWDNKLKEAQTKNNQNEITRLNKLLRHLYSVDSWDYDKKPVLETSRHASITPNTKPRILFVCHDFPPYRYAGAQLYAKNLAQAMNKSGLANVEIFHPVFRQNDIAYGTIQTSEFEGLTVHKLYKPAEIYDPNIIKSSLVEKTFDQFLSSNKYDMIHFHGLGQLSAVPVEIAKKHQIKTIMTLHDYWFLCEEWHMVYPDQNLCSGPESISKCSECLLKYFVEPEKQGSLREAANKYKEARHNYLLKMFDLIDVKIAPSNYLKHKFEEFGFNGIIVQPLGFNIQAPKPKKNNQKLVFGYAGQLISRKGINHLISAFKQLPENTAELHIYGKTNDKQFINRLLGEIKGNDSIKFFGEYLPEQLPEIFSTFDITVIPSLMENYPLLVQESFMFKTPVIASNAGGIPEAVINGENGLIFEAGNVTDLSKCLYRITQESNLIAQMSSEIKAVKSINLDVLEYLKLYNLEGLTQDSINPKGISVQFYIYKNVHWPMFENLYNYIKQKSEVGNITFCIPNISNLIYNNDYTLINQLLSYPVQFSSDPTSANADLTFIADTIAGKVKNCGKIVNIGHGTISKGYYFTDTIWTESENWVDLLCIPGKYAEQRLKDILRTKVVATGMPKMDQVFRNSYNKAQICEELNINADLPIVLYAPTFNIDLSSMFDFAENFKNLDSNQYTILIKLHGSSLSNMLSEYQDIALKCRNMRFVKDSDLSPYLAVSDIMISDVSSAFMEFMALDKPVILYNNPRMTNYHGYNQNDIEYAWRDLAYQVNSIEECKMVLDRLISNKNYDNLSANRKKYREILFYDLQGNASQNVWNESLKLLNSNTKSDIPILSVILRVDNNEFLIRNQVYLLQFYGVMPIELIVMYNSQEVNKNFVHYLAQQNEFYRIKTVAFTSDNEDQILLNEIAQSKGEYLLIPDDGVNFYKNFDYIIHKTFMNNPDLMAFTGVNNLSDSAYYYPRYFDNLFFSEEGLSFTCFNHYKGKQLFDNKTDSKSNLLVFRKSRLNFDPNNSFKENVLKAVHANLIKINPSLYYKMIDDRYLNNLKQTWKRRKLLSENVTESYINELIKVIEDNPYSDFIEILIDLFKPRYYQFKNEIVNLAWQSLYERFYDLDYKNKLLGIISDNPDFTISLKKENELINKISAQSTLQNQSIPNKRIMLYYFKNVHIPILKSLLDKLLALSDKIDLAIGFMAYAPQIRAGFTPEELDILKSYNLPMYDVPQDFKPDVTIIADSVYPWVQNCGKLVHIGHGILCKGQYYTNTKTAQREEQADLVCVPGEYHAQIMRQIISKPVIATGMAKLDPLFKGDYNRDKMRRANNLPEDFKYILFAPTFNDELSAIPFVMDRINEILPDDKCILLIKLHGSTKREYQEMYLNLTELDSRVAFIEDLDITPYLALADIMISDVSSVMIEFAALGKPLILFNNPHWKEYQNYNPDDIEFKFRDIGYQVNSLSEMKEAVKKALAGDDPYLNKRNEITNQLLANKHTGNAVDKICEQIINLIT